MSKTFILSTDRELVEQVFDGHADITHKTSDRFAQDVKDALREILHEYDELKELKQEFSEAERHIDKLEAMLDRRNVRYKKWEDRYL